MTPKTERFEMRLDEDILTRIDEWRAEQDDVRSRSEAMRRLVEIGLMHSLNDTVRFSAGEKLLVMMMGDVYRHLNITKQGEIDPEFVTEAICGGHNWALKWKMPGIFHGEEDGPDDVQFVVAVLNMWSFLERAYEGLSKEDKARVEKEADPFGKNVKFDGFDGNNEGSHLGIARLLVEKMNRFSRFQGRDLNSHYPAIPVYRRMLAVFEPMRAGSQGIELDASQLIEVLSAQDSG